MVFSTAALLAAPQSASTLSGHVGLTQATPAQTVNLRPGNYEMTAVMDMPGMKMPTQKDVSCITAEDLKDLSTRSASGRARSSLSIGSKRTHAWVPFVV